MRVGALLFFSQSSLVAESSLIFFGKSQIEVALHNQQQS
jgi:hypothetical protein